MYCLTHNSQLRRTISSMYSLRTIEIGRWSLLAAALAGIVLVYRALSAVNPTIVALSLLLLILVVAANWSLRHAVVLSIAATACYNFFFLPPVGTFTIADPQNWLALLVFLSVSVIGSRLSQRIRAEATDARSRQREVELLLALSRELLQAEDIADLANSLPGIAGTVCHADGASLYLLNEDRVVQSGKPLSAQTDLSALRYLSLSLTEPCSIDSNETLQTCIPLFAGVRPRGILVLVNTKLSKETSQAIGSLLSIALDRARALDELATGEAAKQSERLRTIILDSITHDLRTPLTSIKAAASTLLGNQAISSEDSLELLTVVDEETDRLNRLVSQAVEMAQLDTRQIQMHTVPISAEELVRRALHSCAGVLATERVTVEIPNLPQMLADIDLTEKALCNILENAAKYSLSDSPIHISANTEDGFVRISVTDHGIGVAPSEKAFIFDRFYRVRSQTSGISGTGMGLSISRAILEAHGGTLTVTSQLGQGSMFTASLPAIQDTYS
jgi:two-component system sensor histidine kinase KdpD